jgi:hypothetical protein
MDSPSVGGRMFSPSLSARPRASSSSLHQVSKAAVLEEDSNLYDLFKYITMLSKRAGIRCHEVKNIYLRLYKQFFNAVSEKYDFTVLKTQKVLYFCNQIINVFKYFFLF